MALKLLSIGLIVGQGTCAPAHNQQNALKLDPIRTAQTVHICLPTVYDNPFQCSNKFVRSPTELRRLGMC